LAFEIGIFEGGRAATTEAVMDAEDDVASALFLVEDAGTIAEAAHRAGKNDNAVLLRVEHLYGLDRLRHFLSVGADILDGRSAEAAGDAAQALDAGTVLGDCVGNKCVPIVSRSRDHENGMAGSVAGKASDGDAEDKSGEAGIGNYQVAAAAEDKEGQVTFPGEGHGFLDFIFVTRLGKVACRPADLQGGQRSERDILLDADHCG